MPKSKIIKRTDNHTVVMFRMDFEIAMLVYKHFTSIGLSDEEVSFLLGKRNKYVFDLLDPTKKDRFKTEQLDILPTILECGIRSLVPNYIKPNENVMICAGKQVYASKVVYKYVISFADKSKSKPVIIVKKIKKGERRKLHPELHDLTLQLIKDGFFKVYKTAIELYLYYKEKMVVPFRPSDLQKSLSICLRNDKTKALLEQGTTNARYTYKENSTNTE